MLDYLVTRRRIPEVELGGRAIVWWAMHWGMWLGICLDMYADVALRRYVPIIRYVPGCLLGHMLKACASTRAQACAQTRA